MRQRLFAILAAISAVAAICTIVGWVQSLVRPTPLKPWTQTIGSIANLRAPSTPDIHVIWFQSVDGVAAVGVNHILSFSQVLVFQGPSWNWRTLGFGFSYRSSYAVLAIPYWFITLTVLTTPALWVYKYKRRNNNPFACPDCGYDLRATKGPCPECGRVSGMQ